jgi:RHS repeat-associated protein
MRCDRLRTALLGGLLLLVAGIPAQAHRGSVCREVLGGEYLACTDLQAAARADALAVASTEQLEEQQRQAAKEEAAAAFGAGLRAALELASVATVADHVEGFELFGLARLRAVEAARAQAAASPLAVPSAPLPRWSPVLVHQALARAALHDQPAIATALPRASEPTSERLRLARFLETRVRAFDLAGGEQHQGNQRFRPGIASDLFHGLWTDPVTGMGYARARWLDHRNASWLSEDPAGTVDSTNLYAYVAWSPQSAIDPLGEESIRQLMDWEDDLMEDRPVRAYFKMLGYTVWNSFTFGFVGEHDQLYETTSGGEYAARTTAAVGKAAAKGAASLAVGMGVGQATAGLSPVASGAITGAAVSGTDLAVEDVVSVGTGGEAHSAGDYVTTMAVGGAIGGALAGAAEAARTGPEVRYSRQHYGGAQTDSAAGRAARAAGQGQPCPTCGNPQVPGTNRAPWPQHDPPLMEHYYDHGGWRMTPAEARSYARSAGAINGTACAKCQRAEGAQLARQSPAMAERHVQPRPSSGLLATVADELKKLWPWGKDDDDP